MATSPIPKTFLALTLGTVALGNASLWAIFAHAPVEAQMGIVQKIFYFHVPSAYAMYVGFTTATVGSVGYLVTRSRKWDAWAIAGAEVGLLFSVAVLLTGPLWARRAWGVYWRWDPQLTATLMAALVYASVVVLRSLGTGDAERRFASALSVVGFSILPVIHYSVQAWRGQHPAVMRSRSGGLDSSMWTALAISGLFFTGLVALLLWARVRAELSRHRLEQLETEAASRALLEDG